MICSFNIEDAKKVDIHFTVCYTKNRNIYSLWFMGEGYA